MKVFGSSMSSVFIILFVFILTSVSFAMNPPVAHWKLDESEGNIAHDEVGIRDGVWVGTIGWKTDAGMYNGAIECFDDSSFIEIDDTNEPLFAVLGNQFTVSVWVMVYEFTKDFQGIITKNNKFFLERNSSGSSGTKDAIHFKVKDDAGAQPFNIYGNITIGDGGWHQVIGIYDVDVAYLYVDAIYDVEGAANGGLVGAVPDPLLIGAKMETTYRNSWYGLIDDVKFFDYALSPEEIDTLYNMEYSTIVEKYNVDPKEFTLGENYPNPFNPTTNINFILPKNTNVTLTIVNINGQNVRTLINEETTAGNHTVSWDGRSDLGQDVPSGVYFYQLKGGSDSQTRKMLLVR